MAPQPATREEIKRISDAKERIGQAINLLAEVRGNGLMVATQLRQFHTALVQMQYDAEQGGPF